MEEIHNLERSDIDLKNSCLLSSQNWRGDADRQTISLPRKRSDVKLVDEVLRRYLDYKLESEEPIPIAVYNTYTLHREEICEEIFQKFGVYIEDCRRFYEGWFIQKIKEIFNEQLIKTGLTKPSLAERREFLRKKEEKVKKYKEKLINWFEELKVTNRKLKTRNPKGIDRLWVSEETGIPLSHLIVKTGKCYEMLNNAARQIGFEKVGKQALSTYLNQSLINRPKYDQLLVFGTECREKELKTRKNFEAQKNNTRHYLFKFLSIKELNLAEEIGPEFGVDFENAVGGVKASIQNLKTRKKFSTEIKRWQRYYNQLLESEYLPANFADAVKLLIETSELTCCEIEKQLLFNRKFNNSLLKRWVDSNCIPSVRSIPKIHKLEKFFGLPQDTLTSKITAFNSKGSLAIVKSFDVTKNCSDVFLYKLIKLLPERFFCWDREKQEVAVKALVGSKQMNTNDYREKLKTWRKHPYSLSARKFPDRLNVEIAEFNEFKTVIYVPEPYIRGKRSRWRNTSGRNGSLNMFLASVESVFGALLHAVEKGKVAVKSEQLTLPLLILPKVWRIYIEFMENRAGAPSSRTMHMNLHGLIHLIKSEEGWLTQNPTFADRLEVIDGILSKEDLEKAKTDWRGFLESIRVELKKILQYIEAELEDSSLSRDSHLPILPILMHDKPWLLLLNALKAYESDIPDKLTAPFQYAVKIRNIVLLRILIETALRQGNLLDLTWNLNNTEQLQRKPDGNYRLVIPHRLFKNSYSRFFGQRGRKQSYVCDLSEELTPFMNIYLEECRPLLIERWKQQNEGTDSSNGGNFLFVYVESSAKRSEQNMILKLSTNSANEIVRDFTSRYLVYNPVTRSGIPGVQTFQMHAVRHIVATHILKMTRSNEEAAKAIQDTPEMVEQYYGMYLPEEEIKNTRSYLQDVIDESNNGFEN